MSYSIEIVRDTEMDEFEGADGFKFNDNFFSVHKHTEWWHFPLEGVAMIHIKQEDDPVVNLKEVT